MTFALRVAGPSDHAAIFPRTKALNAHEGIELTDEGLAASLAVLLADPALGAAWLVSRDGVDVGYAVTTYCFDLEFGGREAWLTELWIDDAARGGGAGGTVLPLLEAELRARGVLALHLQVRPDNPAARLYARLGYQAVPRTVMSRRL
ncbi:MAG TPA: GNAT family N-acetyltransferase [Kofleriaceae bacterium]|jgi:ribosomal protein S18 acetylase RimI-like enzyme